MILPSKELLSVVLNKKVYSVTKLRERHTNTLELLVEGWDDKKYTVKTYINIYELAHKCKEWAIQHHDKAIQITCHKDCIALNIFSDKVDTFVENTEPEAVFKACEWILKQG